MMMTVTGTRFRLVILKRKRFSNLEGTGADGTGDLKSLKEVVENG
jgi:hypothetical protein